MRRHPAELLTFMLAFEVWQSSTLEERAETPHSGKGKAELAEGVLHLSWLWHAAPVSILSLIRLPQLLLIRTLVQSRWTKHLGNKPTRNPTAEAPGHRAGQWANQDTNKGPRNKNLAAKPEQTNCQLSRRHGQVTAGNQWEQVFNEQALNSYNKK